MDCRNSDPSSSRKPMEAHSTVPSGSNKEEHQTGENQTRGQFTLISQGPPKIYQMMTEKKDIARGKVKRHTYGKRGETNQNKVILMVGETGTGKTTMINTMINFLLGVKFEDQEFYQITDEEGNKDQSRSQTSEVTVYEVFGETMSLTIIDTPGFANTEGHEKDKKIAESLIELFCTEDGIHYIDAVCFVMKATQNRLSGKEHYIFHAVLSLFGKDIEENIVFLLSQSDGLPPEDALTAISVAEIPCRKKDGAPVYFLFNNHQKDKRNKQCEKKHRELWEMGEESMKGFFTHMDEENRKSVQMTLDVLKERRRLEACVSNLIFRILEEEMKTDELNQILGVLQKNREKIDRGENFEFQILRGVKEKVLIENEWWWNRIATCCSVCEETCHESCWFVNDLSWCAVMKKDYCTVCTQRCHHSKHIRENKKYVLTRKTVTMTFEELKKDHLLSIVIERFKNETLEKIESDKKPHLLQEAYQSIMSLSQIALKADSASTLQYLDFLISRLKEEKRDNCVRELEKLKTSAEQQKNKWALRYLWDVTKQGVSLLTNITTWGSKNKVEQKYDHAK